MEEPRCCLGAVDKNFVTILSKGFTKMEESYHEFQKISYLLKRGCYNAKRSELKNRVAVLCNLFAHSEVLRGSPQTIECDKRASCPLATELQSKKMGQCSDFHRKYWWEHSLEKSS